MRLPELERTLVDAARRHERTGTQSVPVAAPNGRVVAVALALALVCAALVWPIVRGAWQPSGAAGSRRPSASAFVRTDARAGDGAIALGGRASGFVLRNHGLVFRDIAAVDSLGACLPVTAGENIPC